MASDLHSVSRLYNQLSCSNMIIGIIDNFKRILKKFEMEFVIRVVQFKGGGRNGS